ncbi:MAG: DUF411 domain-containing protein [Chloroflexaceae bacterium]|nr:DUF411 domain-containing protein [Chloroflexaceae bacterium]
MGVLLAACAAPATVPAINEQLVRTMTVYKSPSCGCCTNWIGYVEEHGYTVTVEEVPDLAPVKTQYNIPPTVQSCHTALIDGYIIEGHVPVEDIERLLTERPDVVGIAVPGMPVGSPGMEVASSTPQPFNVMTFDRAGATEVFSSYYQ